MPSIFGKQFSKSELLKLVGDVSQVGGVSRIVLADGPHSGVEAVEFRTGSGLSFLAVPGRGLDITLAEHCGRPLAWRSPVGEVNAFFYEDRGLNWLRSFPGGLVTTCGLTYLGAPCTDEGEELGLHGRFSNTPASNVAVDGEWEGNEYRMWASGKVREARLFGENILLKRKVSALLGQNKIWIDDIVTNEGPRTTPHMILYHVNAGYPVLDAETRFISPSVDVKPRDEVAAPGIERYYISEPPTSGFQEQVYYHEMAADSDGYTFSALVNKNTASGEPFGFYVRYKKNELPKFIQWKMNGTQEYVFGMEPANCWVEGRDKERERGTLQFLEPGESRSYHMEIGVLVNSADVAEIERKAEMLVKAD